MEAFSPDCPGCLSCCHSCAYAGLVSCLLGPTPPPPREPVGTCVASSGTGARSNSTPLIVRPSVGAGSGAATLPHPHSPTRSHTVPRGPTRPHPHPHTSSARQQGDNQGSCHALQLTSPHRPAAAAATLPHHTHTHTHSRPYPDLHSPPPPPPRGLCNRWSWDDPLCHLNGFIHIQIQTA